MPEFDIDQYVSVRNAALLAKARRLDEAVDELRAHGWTCTPPPTPPPYRIDVDRRWATYVGSSTLERGDLIRLWSDAVPSLSNVTHRPFTRYGFTPDDVARTPDPILLTLHGVGPTRLAHVRALVPYVGTL